MPIWFRSSICFPEGHWYGFVTPLAIEGSIVSTPVFHFVFVSLPVDFVKFFTRLSFVLVRLGKVLVVFALVATLSAHWALLQTVAWTTMLANNLQSYSLRDATNMTFDGNHPCPLCRAIAAAKKTEQKNQISFEGQKLEFPPLQGNVILIAPSRFDVLPLPNAFVVSVRLKPPTPPPRGRFV